jgi:hypothetical protein
VAATGAFVALCECFFTLFDVEVFDVEVFDVELFGAVLAGAD